jgi:enoyl-CoA hydratase/carnithine racemase
VSGERKEIVLTGKPFTADEARQWGMVSSVLPGSEVVSEALATAEIIARNAPISVRQAKQAISRGVNMSLWDGLALEIEAYHRGTDGRQTRRHCIVQRETSSDV